MINILTNAKSNDLYDLFKIHKGFIFLDENYINLCNLNNSNLNMYLVLDEEIDNDLKLNCEINNIPVIGIPRYSKYLQHNILKKYDINTPNTIYVNNYKRNILLNVLNNYNNNDKFYCKMERGARGLGQFLATKKQLLNLCDYHNYEIKEYLKQFETKNDIVENKKDQELKLETDYIEIEEKNIEVENQKNKNIMYKHIGKMKCNGSDYVNFYNDMIIQEAVDVLAEYRLMYFYKEKPILVKRTKTENNWQANACNNIGGIGSIIDTDINIEKTDIYKKIDTMCKDLKIPFLSVDLYDTKISDNFNDAGVFEFQMEFGYSLTKKLDYTELHNKLINSVENMYYENK